MKRVLLAILALALLPAVATAKPRIVNGQPASAQELPFMAALEIALVGEGDNGPDALCGGTLVAHDWVVTAAHCLPADPQIDTAHSYAVIGATDLGAATADQRYPLKGAAVSSKYDEFNDGSFDFGFVQLDRPAPGPPLRVLGPGEQYSYQPGATAYTAGWGLTEDKADGGALSTAQLRKVDLRIVSSSDCNSAFEALGGPKLFFDTEICAIAPNKDSCNGDSGGPLFVDDGTGLPALLGAVSFGIPGSDPSRRDRSCNEGPPGVYSFFATGPLQEFYRNSIPNIDLYPTLVPVAGERINIHAEPRQPYRKGKFKGFDHIAWDLNGDGQFLERTDQKTAPLSITDTPSQISVRATAADGSDEIVTRRIKALPYGAVSFAHAKGSAKASSYAKIKLVKLGTGAGSVRISVFGLTTGTTVHFSAHERSKVARLRTTSLDNVIKPHKCHYRFELVKFTGKLVAGTRRQACVRLR